MVNDMNYSPKGMQQLLQDNQFKFKKNFGQNFIVDENIIKAIISKSKIDQDTCILEIGPGAGSLTYHLAKVSKIVVCYEIDLTLKKILDRNLSNFNNIDIIYEDFLKANVKDKLTKYKFKKLYVVANLPYYITTPIIMKIIEDELPVDKIIVMVQKEVGDRFKAQIGTKDYSSLSVFLNYYYDIKKLMDISKNVFIPKPNVDSIIVQFTKKKELMDLKDKSLFFKLIRDSFKYKRKNLRNNLKNYNLDIISEVLKKYNYDLSVRAEYLTLEMFVDIANHLS